MTKTKPTGRPSKLTDTQWLELGRRLFNGEKPTALAREFGTSQSSVSKRFSPNRQSVRDAADALIAAETVVRKLPSSEQLAARSVAQAWGQLADSALEAARKGMHSADCLAELVQANIKRLSPVDTLAGESGEALRAVAVLTEVMNKSANLGSDLLRTNKRAAEPKDTTVQLLPNDAGVL